MNELHIDIETYSSVDLKKCGSYKYFESNDFEILVIAYAYNKGPINVIDLAQGDEVPDELIHALQSRFVLKIAHNANFERLAFRRIQINTPLESWRCSAVKAAYCGLPFALEQVSTVLELDDKAKSTTGKALIKYFCVPCKPTKVNGGRTRNFPHHDVDKWEAFKSYCAQDVEAERAVCERLGKYNITDFEQKLYALDQKINDRGVKIDEVLATNAVKIDDENTRILKNEIKKLTGVENPGSVAQLKTWLENATGGSIESLAKENIKELLEEGQRGDVQRVLEIRQRISKSSTKKYVAMLSCICKNGRGHGFFQFYGANRTGRWAGRLVQLQNLVRNYLKDLDLARQIVRTGDLEDLSMAYGEVSDTLAQLIRTSLVAPEGETFAVADFSAIEARVIAWLAGEKWRIEVFNTHGKIYEASASAMFGVPLADIGKGSDLRQKGKVAELALGYGGGVGALTQMGGLKMGLDEEEMADIIKRWRKASPAIVSMWRELENCAKEAVREHKKVISKYKNLIFDYDGFSLTIKLPSGRSLFYHKPFLKPKRVELKNGETWQTDELCYQGMDQVKKTWTVLKSYGGKITENVVQAIARDLLAESLVRLDKAKYKTVMHVHDEVVAEVQHGHAEQDLEIMCEIMSRPVKWAQGLRLTADGYITRYYKKD